MRFFLFIFIFTNLAYSQSNNIFEKKFVYLFFRSTENKINIIAKDFNINDTLMTHVGLGVYSENKIMIYNIDVSDVDSALKVDNLESFTNISQIKAFSIWKLPKNNSQYRKLKNYLLNLRNKFFEFDYSFTRNNKKYYCSEFVYEILSKSNIIKETLYVSKELNKFYSKALKKDILIYIPVDSFLYLEKIEFVFSKDFK